MEESLYKMIYPSDFPENGVLLEWSERQQALFSNEIINGKPNSRLYQNGLEVVFAASSDKEAFLVYDMVESLIKPKGNIGYGGTFTARQIQLLIKKLVTFSDKYSKITSKRR